VRLLAALACALCVAGPAAATEVGVRVTNEAAPRVWFVTPAEGARLPAGEDVEVRAASEGADRLWIAVDGTRRWSGGTDALTGIWTPGPGRHRLVAVAERDGAPDALASIDVEGVAPAPAAAPPGPPHGATPAPPDPSSSPSAPGPSGAFPPALPGRPVDPDPGDGIAPAPAQRSQAGPGGAADVIADDRGGLGPIARVARFLSDPEKVAWTAAFPLLLLIAAGAYALLQRFIDGGQKLAWRARGRPDDVMVEF